MPCFYGGITLNILGIETSCDETSAAVVTDGRIIRSNVIYSQIDLHTLYGGVVPEIASRMHIEKISTVVKKALSDAEMTYDDIDGIAVTYGPGLVGALICGVSYAKGLSYSLNKPLIPVHHIKGHIAANYLTFKELEPPFLCLIVSGGHSHIVEVTDYDSFEIIGRTRDDAAGEVFDKVGRVLNLPYPGGAKIDKLSYEGNKNAISFPKVIFEDGSLDFSFSGVKTAVINYIHRIEQSGVNVKDAAFDEPLTKTAYIGNGVKQNVDVITKADIAASFTEAVTGILVRNTIKAANNRFHNKIVLAGGVACNTHLRALFKEKAKDKEIYFPEPVLCTDNGAMIASMGYYRYIKGMKNEMELNLNAVPYINITDERMF